MMDPSHFLLLAATLWRLVLNVEGQLATHSSSSDQYLHSNDTFTLRLDDSTKLHGRPGDVISLTFKLHNHDVDKNCASTGFVCPRKTHVYDLIQESEDFLPGDLYPTQIRVLTGDEHTFTVGQLSVPRKEEGKKITYTRRAEKRAEINWTHKKKREAEVPPQGQGIPSWNDNQGSGIGGSSQSGGSNQGNPNWNNGGGIGGSSQSGGPSVKKCCETRGGRVYCVDVPVNLPCPQGQVDYPNNPVIGGIGGSSQSGGSNQGNPNWNNGGGIGGSSQSGGQPHPHPHPGNGGHDQSGCYGSDGVIDWDCADPGYNVMGHKREARVTVEFTVTNERFEDDDEPEYDDVVYSPKDDRCRGPEDSQCHHHWWKVNLKVQDEDSGLRKVQVFENGVNHQNSDVFWRHRNFDIGTNHEVDVEAMANCCVEKMRIVATDVQGKNLEIFANLEGKGAFPTGTVLYAIIGAVAAVVLIIVIIILVCCYQKKACCCGPWSEVSQNER